jgi:hypothetical protein
MPRPAPVTSQTFLSVSDIVMSSFMIERYTLDGITPAIYRSAWRDCLIIPEEVHCGLSRGPRTGHKRRFGAIRATRGARARCQSDLSDSLWKGNSPKFRYRGVGGVSAPAADRFARRPPPQRWQRWSLARRAFRTTVIRASPPSRHGGCCWTRGWPVCPDA